MRVMKPMDLLKRHIRDNDPIYFRVKGDTWLRLTTGQYSYRLCEKSHGQEMATMWVLEVQIGDQLQSRSEWHSPHLLQLLKLSILDKVRTGDVGKMDNGLDTQELRALEELHYVG